METRKQAILAALDKFTRQRAGLEFGNYGDVASYRSEQRSITKDLHHYRELERYVMLHDSITADMLLEAAKRAYSGRLTIRQCVHGSTTLVRCGANHKHVWCEACDPAPSALCHWCHGRGYSKARHGATVIDYCTGQYFPTEYRRAACAVLSAAIWAWWREHCMPEKAGTIKRGEFAFDAYMRGKVRMSGGDWLRSNARREFSRGVAARWFD